MVWGAPLSGKTTFSKTLAEKLGVPYLNVQELLARHMQEETEIGHVVCPNFFNFYIYNNIIFFIIYIYLYYIYHSCRRNKN
jgi:hypothetical protein